MKIAAQLYPTGLHVYTEDCTWKKTTQPFNREPVKIELAAFMTANRAIFHYAGTRPEAVTDASLKFCRGKLTLGEFKKKLKQAGLGEPDEVRLGNSQFLLEKQFGNAYSLVFQDFRNNQAFNDWLATLPTLEAGFLLQRMRGGRRYYTKDFAEFLEYNSIDQFIRHRFDLWHESTVKELVSGLTRGSTHSNGGNI